MSVMYDYFDNHTVRVASLSLYILLRVTPSSRAARHLRHLAATTFVTPRYDLPWTQHDLPLARRHNLLHTPRHDLPLTEA